MSTRLIVDGRTLYRRGFSSHPRELPATPYDPSRAQRVPLSVRNAPAETLWPDEYGVRHRIVDNLDMKHGWQTAETYAKWFGITEKEFRKLAMQGLFDNVVKRGSQVGFYKVIDVTNVRREVALMQERAKTRSRPKKTTR